MPTSTKRQYRIFVEYPMDRLVRSVGRAYSLVYLSDIERGAQPPTDKFKSTMAAILKRDEAWLFEEVEVADG